MEDKLIFYILNSSNSILSYIENKNILLRHKIQKIRENFSESLAENNFSIDIFSKLESELERVKTLKTYFNWNLKSSSKEDHIHKHYLNFLKYFTKCDITSIKFRELGNEAYKSKSFDLALRAYSLAVQFSKNNIELVKGFSNRSAVLYEIKCPNESINDINRCIRIIENEPYSSKLCQDLLQKLVQRKEKCNKMLKTFSPISENKIRTKMSHINNSVQHTLFELKDKSKKIEAGESFVKIEEDTYLGRKLVVTKDVECGTLLLVERPFSASLENELKYDTEHCRSCFSYLKFHQSIPCQYCTAAVFCSEKCREKSSRNFHQYEHDLIPALISSDMSDRDLLLLRILTTEGPNNIHKVFLSSLEQSKKETPGREKNYNSAYNEILNLVSHPPQNSVDNISNVFNALVLCNILKYFSPFFKTFENDEHFFDFVTSLLLRHLESAPYNAISFNELQLSKEHELTSVPFATGLFPTLSLMNHSCAPNAVHVRRLKWCETGVISLKHLRKGEEIRITYGPKFTTKNRKERQGELLRKYKFRCKCEACEGLWNINSLSIANEDEDKSKFEDVRIEFELINEKLREILAQSEKLKNSAYPSFLTTNSRSGFDLLVRRENENFYEEAYKKLIAGLEKLRVVKYPNHLTLVGEELLKKALLFYVNSENFKLEDNEDMDEVEDLVKN